MKVDIFKGSSLLRSTYLSHEIEPFPQFTLSNMWLEGKNWDEIKGTYLTLFEYGKKRAAYSFSRRKDRGGCIYIFDSVSKKKYLTGYKVDKKTGIVLKMEV